MDGRFGEGITVKRSRWSFAGLMDLLSCCRRNSIAIGTVYLLRSNLMLIALLRRRYIVSSTLYGLSTIWMLLVSIFFWEAVVDLVYPSRRYGVEIITLTSWCFVEFVWMFFCVWAVCWRWGWNILLWDRSSCRVLGAGLLMYYKSSTLLRRIIWSLSLCT